MNKTAVFTLGFFLGAGASAAALFGWIAHRVHSRSAQIPAHFEDASLQRLPFKGEWLVFWGGEKKKDNHHFGVSPQNLAMDIVKTQPGTNRTFEGDRTKNESYACWAEPLYAPCDGVVEISVDGIPDNIPGEMNAHMVSGNCMMIRSKADFVVVLCHFKNGSVAKKKGDVVRTGDLLGLCGNSGNSSAPHLHFHIQSEVGFVKGVALRPIFQSVEVDGVLKKNFSPIKGDKIANPKEEP